MMRRTWTLAVALLALAATVAGALEVRLVGDRCWLNARGAPLVDVLKAFAHLGVRVKLDPEAEATVSGRVADEPVEAVLQKVLEPFGYVLIWDVIEGPVGRFPKLEEIQVFKPGRKEKAEPLRGVDENFSVATGPDGRGPKFVQDELLIGFKPGARRDDFERLIREIGGTVVGSVPGVGVYLVRLPQGTNLLDLLAQLARNPLVARAEPNYVTEMKTPGGRGGMATAADAMGVQVPAKGKVPVAILDSGIMPLAGLGDSVVGAYDAVHPEREPSDTLGHGTQMAMVAAGAVEPGATGPGSGGVPVVAIRAFDDNGNTSNYSLMRSIAYALDQGARVINMSWGSEVSSEFLEAAIRYAQSRGAIVVAAAGNEPTGKPVYPAAYPGVVAVSALGADGNLWRNSNTGGFVSFAAPGTAEFPVGFGGPPGSYAGTSIASAYVARTLGLYLSQNEGATPRDAVAALQSAARDAGATGRDAQYGYGVLDAAAVSRLLGR